jgi:hypothetical protein
MLLLAIFAMSFGSGYGAREWLSHRRRAVERERYKARHARNLVLATRRSPPSAAVELASRRALWRLKQEAQTFLENSPAGTARIEPRRGRPDTEQAV